MFKLVLALTTCGLFAGTLGAAEAVDPAKSKPKPYPLTTCVVSGEALGEMGEAVVVERNGREVKFCCKGCVKDFDKKPEKYIKKMEEAEKAAPAAK